MLKKGDTLIEVTLAVGIFSLVAIAVVAVVNGSTTGAQTALETTLTRDEIDAQADALRFIQSSYAGSLNPSAENVYSDEITGSAFATIWDAIVANAHPSNAVDLDELLFNNPARKDNPCNALYEPETNGLDTQKAFVINTKKLSDINLGDDDIAKNIVIKATTDSLKTKTFTEAQTYPHVIYKDPDEEETTDPEALVGSDSGSIVDRAEGVYIVAVKDTNTVIVSGDGQIDNGSSNPNSAMPAYYDFYIRSCWYPTGSETPTTISTVMRLDNPVLLANTIVPEDDLTVPIYIRTSPGIDRVILNGTECTTQTVCRVNNLVRGQSYPLTAVLKEYYDFETYKNSNNQGRIANPLKIETTYTVGNRSTIITPYAKSKAYDIYIIPENGVASVTLAGTSCTNKSGCVVKDLQQGTRYPLTATLEAHYDFVEWINTESRGAVGNSKAAITNYTVGNGPTILRATAKLQTFDCNKRYRLQNADGSYPSSYTNDGSTKVEYGSTCTYSKSMDGYVSQSKSVTITGATTISLDLPRTTYTLTVNRNSFAAHYLHINCKP